MTDRTLFVEVKEGLRKITIPADWTISFGPLAVGLKSNGMESPNVLRIYADKKRADLVAVYRDVISVSDERVIVSQKKTTKKQKVFHKRGGNGEQSFAAEIRKTSWTNPYADEPEAEDGDFDESILKLPAGFEEQE